MSTAAPRGAESAYDAIIVGAGPAGSACAITLARAGRRVLIVDRKSFPRDKSCGDGLTPHALQLLERLGAGPKLAGARRVRGVRLVHLGGRRERERDFDYRDSAGRLSHGLVVPRIELDHILLGEARRQGAAFLPNAKFVDLLRNHGRVDGIVFERDGVRRGLRAAYVVAADGANSQVADAAGRNAGEGVAPGFAIRCYVDGIAGELDRQEIYLPLADPSAQYLLPSYGWVFPTGDCSANVGVGIFRKLPFDNVRSLYERFLARLFGSDPRFVAARAGAPAGAPLRFDFDPGRCSLPGLLLVGDAAGLTSPFTGEGISYALESGRLAAEAIVRTLRRSPAAPRAEDDYALLMANAFAGYFEAGRRSAQRHQLMWHVLDSSFDNDRPMFSLLRRAALVPEASGGGSVLPHLNGSLGKGDSLMRRQLIDIGAQLIAAVRRDWPLVGRMEIVRTSARNPVFRPSLLMLLAARFGDPQAPQLVEMGAALDLVFIALLAQSSVTDDDGRPACDSNWSNKFSILSGDYLMSRGVELATSPRFEHGDLIMETLERSCRGRIAQLKLANRLDVEPDVALGNAMEAFAGAFVLPIEIGAHLAGVPYETRVKLVDFARWLGAAAILHDDLLSVSGERADAVPLFSADWERGVAAVPILLSAQSPQGQPLIQRAWACRPFDRARIVAAMRETVGIEQTQRMIEIYRRKARSAASTLPACPARSSLHELSKSMTGSE